MKTVYADVVLISNFCLDYIIIYMSIRFLNINIYKYRMIIAALAGAVFSLVAAITVNTPILRLLSAIVFLPLLCMICIGFCEIKDVIKMSAAMYMFSFLLCGITSAVYNAFGNSTDFSCLLTSVGALLLLWVSKRMKTWVMGYVSAENQTVIITCGNKEKTYLLMCDSGNKVFDPYVKLPVIFLKQSEKSNLIDCTIPLRLVPVSTAAGHVLAEGFTPDSVVIRNGKSEKRVTAAVCFIEDENITECCGDGILPQILI